MSEPAVSSTHASSTPTSRRRLRACGECDLVLTLPSLRPREKAFCPRCGHTLARRNYRPAQRSLALALAALVALALAVTFPFVSFRISGIGNRIDLAQTATTLLGFEQPLVALAVLLTIIVLPTLYLLGLIRLQWSLLRGSSGTQERTLARMLAHITPWMMADVFIIGALVSLIKIAGTAEIVLGPGFWAFCAFAGLLLFTTQSIDADWLWYSLAGEPLAPEAVRRGEAAAAQGLCGCDTCGLLNRLEEGRCRRCGDRLHARRPHSLQATWALLVAAVVLYVPANLYPIMTTITFGKASASTIIGGVAELWLHGSWPIALVIFVASIMVPVAKLLVLGWLCIVARRSAVLDAALRTRVYRIIEFVGRWSMVDVFVVALLVALIRADALMAINPGPAALAFCAVVVLTMVAALVFDPRLLWDEAEVPAAKAPAQTGITVSGAAA